MNLINLTSLTEQCKQEIRYAADYARVPYDEKDLLVFPSQWGTVVAIMWINLPMLETDEDGQVIETGPKRLNIWFDKYMRARIICPFLVRIILPDGTIKRDRLG